MEQKQAAVGMTKLDRENVYEWKKVKDRITTHLVERAGVPFLQFSLLEETGIVTHAFSTRLGGVSEGVCSTMNVSSPVATGKKRYGKTIGGWAKLWASTAPIWSALIRPIPRTSGLSPKPIGARVLRAQRTTPT